MKLYRLPIVASVALILCWITVLPANAQVTETYCSTDVPVFIDSVGTPIVTSNLNVPDNGIIQNVVVSLQIDHTFQDDLIVDLESPSSTSVLLFANVDGSNNNFGTQCNPFPNFILDDDASTPVGSINTSDPTGAFIPEQPLSLFDGQNQAGLWILTINDTFNLDGGFLNCWCLEITSGLAISNVPTMNEWAMMAFATMLGAAGAFFIYMRRRHATS